MPTCRVLKAAGGGKIEVDIDWTSNSSVIATLLVQVHPPPAV